MSEIKVEKRSRKELEQDGVFNWPIWQKEVSTFDWHYHDTENCYLLEGQVRVEPVNGPPTEFGAGDFVTFPKGMDCVWKIIKPVKKHYNFG